MRKKDKLDKILNRILLNIAIILIQLAQIGYNLTLVGYFITLAAVGVELAGLYWFGVENGGHVILFPLALFNFWLWILNPLIRWTFKRRGLFNHVMGAKIYNRWD